MPIRHILLFKVRPDAKPEQIQSWRSQLESMKNKVPGISELRVAKHSPPFSAEEGYNDRSSGYTWVLDGTYEDADVLKQYTVHPDHRAAQAYSREFITDATQPAPVIAMDYEYG